MKVAFQTLGCKVNLYESEAVWSSLKELGYVKVSFNDFADVYIINTCTVTNKGDSKSRKLIRQAVKRNPDAVVAVMGCYSQTKPDEVMSIDGVDIVIGTNSRSELPHMIENFIKERRPFNEVSNIMKVNTFENLELSTFTENTRAFLKIQDGCNEYCSYCIIPFARGRMRSRKPEDVLSEAKRLIENGYKEIVLTGIHTGGYGIDFEDYTFADLLKELSGVEGLKRLRISSIEINELTEEVLKVIKDSDVIVNHLHIPLQSGCDSVLQKMNRKYSTSEFASKINYIRSLIEDIAITSDVIVGFPQETEEEFQSTYDFIEKMNLSELHVFPYSKRSGTRAAGMPNQIDSKVKQDRVKRLMELSDKLKSEYISNFIGSNVDVLVERYNKGKCVGHTTNYLLVEFDSEEELKNEIVNVKLINYDGKKIKGELVK